jgi:D-arginine dehydrogenase
LSLPSSALQGSATAFDVIVLGAGMAGASIAAELAPHRRVLLLEREDQPGRHTTGRSAAMFFESYGNATVRGFTRASRAFLEQPPEGFAEVPLMSPRAALFVAGQEALPRLQAMIDAPDAAPTLCRLSTAQTLALVPILRPEAVAGGALDDSGCDMEVAAILQGYLRLVRRGGAQVVLGGTDVLLQRAGGLWTVDSRAGRFQAPVVVNATGAWADELARQAGAQPVGLQPMRRTAMTIPAPQGHDTRHWPMVIDVDETVYFKPDAGQMLLSPANEDPMPPCDVAPEELDIALAVHRFEELTTVPVKRIAHRWAGLRSFVADRSPVAGWDPRAEGFFWLAGQGGYGIQMAPALARAAAAMLLGQALPADIAAQGVTPQALSPDRLRPSRLRP